MLFGKNLRFLRRAAGESQDLIAKLTGKSVPTVQRWEVEMFEPSLEVAGKIAAHYMVSLQEMCEIDFSAGAPSRARVASRHYEIPLAISAGDPADCPPLSELPQMEVPDAILGRWAHDRRVVMMHINGDSMNNLFPSGCVVAVLTGIEKEQLKPGDVVVAEAAGAYTVKRFYDDAKNRRVVLRPDSADPSFTDLVFPYDAPDPLIIFGRVVVYPVFI